MSVGSIADVFFAKSSDNGTSFTDPVNLSNDTEVSINPYVATSGRNVYVA
jgi:hypothetical protein